MRFNINFVTKFGNGKVPFFFLFKREKKKELKLLGESLDMYKNRDG